MAKKEEKHKYRRHLGGKYDAYQCQNASKMLALPNHISPFSHSCLCKCVEKVSCYAAVGTK